MKKIILFAILVVIFSAFGSAQTCVSHNVSFDKDNTNTNLRKGQVIDLEYNGGTGLGNNFVVSALNGGTGPNFAVLAAISQLVISENGVDNNQDNLIDNPVASTAGGKLIFSFARPVTIKKVRVLDVNEANGRIKTYGRSNNLRADMAIPASSANSIQELLVETENGTMKLEVSFTGTAALTYLEYCEDALPKCGDNIVNQQSEQCDDGNTVNGDGCTSQCKLEQIVSNTCGNSICEVYESAKTCPADCSAVCGNGIIEKGETCDGNCPNVLVDDRFFTNDTSYRTYTRDVTSNKNDGQVMDAAWTANGKIGGAYEFDGVNDYISVSDSTQLNPNEITISFWLYLNSDSNCDNNNNWVSILSKGTTSNILSGYNLVLEEGRWITFSVGNGTNSQRYYSNGATLPIKEWVYVTATYNSTSGESKVFLNGQNISGGYWSSMKGNIASNNNPLRINKYSGQTCSNGDGSFNGSIDDFKIYSKAVSTIEVQSLYLNNNPPSDNLALYLPFDSSSSYKVPNNNDGELYDLKVAQGKAKEAYDFNGASSAILIQNLNRDAFKNGFTFSSWVKRNGDSPSSQEIFNNNLFFLRTRPESEDAGNTFEAFVRLQDGLVEPRVNSGVNAELNTWYMVTVTWDKTDLVIYVDGVEKGRVQRQGQLNTEFVASILGMSEGLNIMSNFFNGTIDEVRVYNRALAGNEVTELYNSNATQSGLVMYLPLDSENLYKTQKEASCPDCKCQPTSSSSLVCKYTCDADDQCRINKDCKPVNGKDQVCSKGCTCIDKPLFCDVDQGSRCDAKDASYCQSYEKCDLDPGACSCVPDGLCHPGVVSGHTCDENSDCKENEMCSGCKCIKRVPVCGDGRIDKPNKFGIYEQCDADSFSNCKEGQYCSSNCQCENVACNSPVDIAFFVDPSGSMADESKYLCDAVKTIKDVIDNDPKANMKYTIKLLGPLYPGISNAVTYGKDGSATCAASGGNFSGIYTKVYDTLKSCSGISFDVMDLDIDYAPCESWGVALNDFATSNFWRKDSLRMAFVFSDEDASRGNDADSCNDDPRCTSDTISKSCYLADNVCQTQKNKHSWCEQSCAGLPGAKNTYSGKALTMGYGGTGAFKEIIDVSGYYGKEDWDVIQKAIPVLKANKIKAFTVFDSLATVTNLNGVQVLGTGVMGECNDKCILFHHTTLAKETGGAVFKANDSFSMQRKIFDEIKNLCAGGCSAGKTLCKDGTCSYDCIVTDLAPQGCINKNGKCEFGEGCACSDCLDARDSCAIGAICGKNEFCGCPKGTTLCNDGVCDKDCKDHFGKMGCIGKPNNVCDKGEGCACPDCYNRQDSCIDGLTCQKDGETCGIPAAPVVPQCIPKQEVCGDHIDNDCDGVIDNGCDTETGEPAFVIITEGVKENPRILDKFKLIVKVKNNLNSKLSGLKLYLDLPEKFAGAQETIDVDDIEPKATKEIAFEVYILDYDKEEATITINAESSSIAKISKELSIDVDIPRFLIAPNPMQLDNTNSDKVCLDFYYAINLGDYQGVSDIELDIIDDKLLVGKSVLVDYLTDVDDEAGIIVKPMISNPYCLPAGNTYSAKGYLYRAGPWKIVDTVENSNVELMLENKREVD